MIFLKFAQNWRAIVILLSDQSLSSGANNVNHHSVRFYCKPIPTHRCSAEGGTKSQQLSTTAKKSYLHEPEALGNSSPNSGILTAAILTHV